jgi:hypothetical protein
MDVKARDGNCVGLELLVKGLLQRLEVFMIDDFQVVVSETIEYRR